MSEALLSLNDLAITLGGKTLVSGVSLTIAPGEIVGLVGASGSGKSLTALAVLGLLPEGALLSGTHSFAGAPLAAVRRGQDAGLIFQEPMTALNPVMRVGDQVAETLLCHGIARAEAQRRAAETLAQVGLPEMADRYPHQLSGGQRQRVAIAIAIALKPRLLIADEPTTALDSTTERQIVTLLRRLVEETGMGLLLISHDLPLVEKTAHRVVTLGSMKIPAPIARRRTPPGDILLAGRGLVRDYRHPKHRALNGVDITIRAGESVVLIGESGSGKSTLLRILLSLEAPQAGSVALNGRIQAVFQDPAGSLDPRWSVERILAEPLPALAGIERRRRVEEALIQVGLSPADADRFPREFSGGQRQRIAIARALIVEPDIIVFDEATSALDLAVKAQILNLLAELSSSRRFASLFVTHDLEAVRPLADRVLTLEKGRIVAETQA